MNYNIMSLYKNKNTLSLPKIGDSTKKAGNTADFSQKGLFMIDLFLEHELQDELVGLSGSFVSEFAEAFDAFFHVVVNEAVG